MLTEEVTTIAEPKHLFNHGYIYVSLLSKNLKITKKWFYVPFDIFKTIDLFLPRILFMSFTKVVTLYVGYNYNLVKIMIERESKPKSWTKEDTSTRQSLERNMRRFFTYKTKKQKPEVSTGGADE